MRVIIFGASGMVGQGVLRECLLSDEVEKIVSVVRKATGQTNAKLTELVHADFYDFTPLREKLSGYDACFFCLGISSAGMGETEFKRITYDITLAAAKMLAPSNPNMTFIYVSGSGTDSTEQGRVMWARIKGKTENALKDLPFKRVYFFRPGYIQPLHGIQSKTPLYRTLYKVVKPFYPLLKATAPKAVTTTEQVGRAMLKVAKEGAPEQILHNSDINAL